MVFSYILWIYWKDTRGANLAYNRYYDGLLAVSPWAIFFDGATAWTVNQPQIVPDAINLLLHGLFFIFMDLTIIFSMLYMWHILVGLPKSKGKLALILSPPILSIVLILTFLKDLYYIDGVTTRYSMGISVIACYASVVIHFGMILCLIIMKYKIIEKRKRTSILVCVLFSVCVLVYQIMQPEALLTSIFPVMMVLGLYINIEDPAKRRLEQYNLEVVSSFATLVENRDDSTGNHVKRTRGYVEIILKEMQKTAAYKRVLAKDYIDHVMNTAPMYDIGKTAIPDHIRQKPGKLTGDEFSLMKTHTVRGGEMILETFQTSMSRTTSGSLMKPRASIMKNGMGKGIRMD